MGGGWVKAPSNTNPATVVILLCETGVATFYYLFNFPSNDGDLVAQLVVFDELLAVHRDTAGLNTVDLPSTRLNCKE